MQVSKCKPEVIHTVCKQRLWHGFGDKQKKSIVALRELSFTGN